MNLLAGLADLRDETSFMGFLKPRLKLTFGYMQSWHSYPDSATPEKGLLTPLKNCVIRSVIAQIYVEPISKKPTCKEPIYKGRIYAVPT